MAYYWYQNDPELYKAEVMAMRKYFPSFQINQLQDGSGRLYWRGKVQPTGKGGMVWDLMLIYKNNHPHAGQDEYGGSIQILPVQPRLKTLAEQSKRQIVGVYIFLSDMISLIISDRLYRHIQCLPKMSSFFVDAATTFM